MGTSVMGFRDAQRAYDIELPDVPGVTALAMRSVLNVVALATDDENQQTFVSHSTIS